MGFRFNGTILNTVIIIVSFISIIIVIIVLT